MPLEAIFNRAIPRLHLGEQPLPRPVRNDRIPGFIGKIANSVDGLKGPYQAATDLGFDDLHTSRLDAGRQMTLQDSKAIFPPHTDSSPDLRNLNCRLVLAGAYGIRWNGFVSESVK